MSFFKRLASLFTGNRSGSDRQATIYVLSHRCNEPISAEIDLLNELSQSDDPDATYYTRKLILGSGANRCFSQVEVELWFDNNRTLLRHEVQGGRWLTEQEYAAELTRFNASLQAEEEQEGENLGDVDRQEGTDQQQPTQD